MLVAVCDQPFGTSTSSCRKIVTPFSFPISAVRFSHSTMSKGDFIPSVKYRSKARPFAVVSVVVPGAISVVTAFPLNACFTVAILFLRAFGLPLARGTLPFYSSALCRVAALRFQVWVEATAARFDKFVKAACEKKADRLAIVL